MADSFQIIIDLRAQGLDAVQKIEKTVTESVNRMAAAVEAASKRMDAALTGALTKASAAYAGFAQATQQAAAQSRAAVQGLGQLQVAAGGVATAARGAAQALQQVGKGAAAAGAAAGAAGHGFKSFADQVRRAADAAKLFAIGAGLSLARSLSSGPIVRGLNQMVGAVGGLFEGINRRVGFVNVRGGIFGGLANAAVSSAAVATRVFANLGANIITSAGQAATGAIRALSGIPVAFGEAVSRGLLLAGFALRGFPGIITSVLGGVIGIWTSIWSALQSIAATALEAISKTIAGVFEGAVRFVATFVEGATRILTKLFNSAVRIFGQIAEAISAAFGKVLGFVSKAAAAVTEKFTGLFERAITEAGKFQTAMNRVFGQMEKVPTLELQIATEDAVRRVARATGLIATDVANTAREIESGMAPAFIKTAGGIEGITFEIAKLKRLEPFAELSAVTDLFVRSLNVARVEGLKATEVTRLLYDTARLGVFTLGDMATGISRVLGNAAAAGLKLEDVLRVVAATSRVLSPEAAFTGIRNLVTVISAPRGQQAKELEDLGIPVRELPPRVKKMVDATTAELNRLRGLLEEFQPGVERVIEGRVRIVGRVTRVEDQTKEQVAEKIRGLENEISRLNLQGPTRQLSDFILEIAKVGSESEEAAARLAFIFPNIRGRAGFGALFQQFRADKDFFREFVEGIRRDSKRFDEEWERVRQSFELQWDRMKRSVEDFFIAIGKPFLQPLARALEQLGGVFDRLRTRLFGAFDLDSLAQKLGGFLDRAIRGFEEFINSVIDGFPVAWEAVKTFAENARNSFKGLWETLSGTRERMEGLARDAQGFFERITGATLGDIGRSALVGRFDAIGKAISATFHTAAAAIQNAMADALKVVADFLRGLIPVAVDVAGTIGKVFANLFNFIVDRMKEAIGSKVTGLLAAIGELDLRAKVRVGVMQEFEAQGMSFRESSRRARELERQVPRFHDLEAEVPGALDRPGVSEALNKLRMLDFGKLALDQLSKIKPLDPAQVEAAIRSGVSDSLTAVTEAFDRGAEKLRSSAEVHDLKAEQARDKLAIIGIESRNILADISDKMGATLRVASIRAAMRERDSTVERGFERLRRMPEAFGRFAGGLAPAQRARFMERIGREAEEALPLRIPGPAVPGEGGTAIGVFQESIEAAEKSADAAAKKAQEQQDLVNRQLAIANSLNAAIEENTRPVSQFLIDIVQGLSPIQSMRAERRRQAEEQIGRKLTDEEAANLPRSGDPRRTFRALQRDLSPGTRKSVLEEIQQNRLQAFFPNAPEADKALEGVAGAADEAAKSLKGLAGKDLPVQPVRRFPEPTSPRSVPSEGPAMLRQAQGPPRRDEGLPPREREEDFQKRFHEWSEAQKPQGTLEQQRQQRIEEWKQQGIWPGGLSPEEEPVGPSGRPASAEWQWEPSGGPGKGVTPPDVFGMAAPREPRIPTPPFEGLSMAEIIDALAPKEDISLTEGTATVAEAAKKLADTAKMESAASTENLKTTTDSLLKAEEATASRMNEFAAIAQDTQRRVLDIENLLPSLSQAF